MNSTEEGKVKHKKQKGIKVLRRYLYCAHEHVLLCIRPKGLEVNNK